MSTPDSGDVKVKTEPEPNNLEVLTEKIEGVRALLGDPHPGLFTWQEVLHRRMTDLVAWWVE